MLFDVISVFENSIEYSFVFFKCLVGHVTTFESEK